MLPQPTVRHPAAPLHRSLLACTLANGDVENRATAHVVFSDEGDSGAVGEMGDLILTVQNHYARYFEVALGA